MKGQEMFKVYKGLTIGANYAADYESENPIVALDHLKGLTCGILTVEHTDDDKTILAVKINGKILDTIKGTIS